MTELQFLTALLDRLATHEIHLRIGASDLFVMMTFEKGDSSVPLAVDRARMRDSYAGAEWVLLDDIEKAIAKLLQMQPSPTKPGSLQ